MDCIEAGANISLFSVWEGQIMKSIYYTGSNVLSNTALSGNQSVDII